MSNEKIIIELMRDGFELKDIEACLALMGKNPNKLYRNIIIIISAFLIIIIIVLSYYFTNYFNKKSDVKLDNEIIPINNIENNNTKIIDDEISTEITDPDQSLGATSINIDKNTLAEKSEFVWKKYNYKLEKFSIDFPMVPKIKDYQLNFDSKIVNFRQIEVAVSSVRVSGLKYSVEYVTPPSIIFGKKDLSIEKEKKAIDFYKNALINIYGIKNTKFEIGLPLLGHEVVNYKIKNSLQYFEGRIVSLDGKIYSYSGECMNCTVVPDIDKYLDSFSLLE